MQDGSCIEEMFNSIETGPLANVLACEGKPGKVLLCQLSVVHAVAHFSNDYNNYDVFSFLPGAGDQSKSSYR